MLFIQSSERNNLNKKMINDSKKQKEKQQHMSVNKLLSALRISHNSLERERQEQICIYLNILLFFQYPEQSDGAPTRTASQRHLETVNKGK